MVLVWEPITDLPESWRELTDGELGPLLQFWNDQCAEHPKTSSMPLAFCRTRPPRIRRSDRP